MMMMMVMMMMMMMMMMMIIIIINNLIYIAQFDTNGILTALYIAIKCTQMQSVHILWTNMNQSYSYIYTCPHIIIYIRQHMYKYT